MRIIPFPGQPHTAHDERWLAELEAALDGDTQGPAAESWRQLREDVCALATPMSPGSSASCLSASPNERTAPTRPAAVASKVPRHALAATDVTPSARPSRRPALPSLSS